jgi:hypothetical protein
LFQLVAPEHAAAFRVVLITKQSRGQTFRTSGTFFLFEGAAVSVLKARQLRGLIGAVEIRSLIVAIEEARLASVEERWKQIMKLGKGTEEKPGDWKALAWSLERTEASSFARPEVQLNLMQQNNTTVNTLSITIAREEIREIEAVAEPVRASVWEMFDRYKPNQR